MADATSTTEIGYSRRNIKLFSSYELAAVEKEVNDFINQDNMFCVETQLSTDIIESSHGKIYTKYTILIKYLSDWHCNTNI